MSFLRPLNVQIPCLPCCLQRMEVTASGSVCGYIEEAWSPFWSKFRILNSVGDIVLRIEGPCCTYSICGDVEFQVLSRDGVSQVGLISKKWSGVGREFFTDADIFGISFPMDLDVKIKAVLLGACILIVRVLSQLTIPLFNSIIINICFLYFRITCSMNIRKVCSPEKWINWRLSKSILSVIRLVSHIR